MAATPTILYLDTIPGDRIQQMKLAGVRRHADALGWHVETVPEKASRPDKIEVLIAHRHPLGCIVECSDGRADLPPRTFGGLPVVYLNCARNLYGGRIAKVVTDNAAIARTAFRELSAARPPAYGVVGFRAVRAWSRVRERAFHEAALASGRPCRVFRRLWGSGGHYDHARADRLARWLATLPPHSAVFAANDATAAEIVDAARATGLRIPKDLTLLGVDNHEPICEASVPALSSVQMDFELAGYRAARMLCDLVAGHGPRVREEAVPPLVAVRRESTRGFGRREPRIAEAVETIRREACDGLTAGALAARFRGSRRLFEMRFRESMGRSILDEIMHVRLEKVETLLSRTDTAIGAIAGLCGFGSEVELRQIFRARTGMSLREWRRRGAR